MRSPRLSRSAAFWSLILINVVLLISFVMRMTRDNTAIAQPARPSDYLAIPGEVIGGTNAVVYVLDQTNRQLAGIVYEDATRTVNVIPTVDLDRAFESGLAEIGKGGLNGGRMNNRRNP